MSFTNLLVKQLFTGDGATLTFTIPFEFTAESEVVVILRDETDPLAITETTLTKGALEDYTLTGQNPPNDPLPTTVTMVVAPTATQKLLVKRELPLDQQSDYTNTGSVSLESLELKVDKLVMHDQQINDLALRALTTAETASTSGGSLTLPPVENGKLLGWVAGGLANVASVLSALGLPTDGTYGGSNGNISGIASGDSPEDGFDKVETILGKLAPARPAAITAISLSVSSTVFNANITGTGATASITEDTTPTAVSSGPFLDLESGILSATVDAVAAGAITLTAADDSSTNDQLTITDNSDPFEGVAGSEGFWSDLEISITVGAAKTPGDSVAFALTHDSAGSATPTSVFIDDSIAPTVSSEEVAEGTPSTKQVSGLTYYDTGSTFDVTFSIAGAIKTFYNDTKIAQISGNWFNTQTEISNGTSTAPHSVDDAFSSALTATLTSGEHFSASGPAITCAGFSADDQTDTAVLNPSYLIDSKAASTDTGRSQSGAGQFPTIGSGATQFGDAFDSSEDLTTSNNEELQRLDTQYQFPPATDWSSHEPSGNPDHSGLTGGSFGTNRWVTLNLGAISASTSETVVFSNTSNFGGSAVVSGFEMYALVDGGSPTSGWVDLNTAYPGVGNPTANGDAALVLGSSTATTKRMTFGVAAKTGNLWVRIGLPSGSTKRFGGVTKS